MNLYLAKPSSTIFYESNNIVFKIKGTRSEALLISSHFDSALASHGVTDAGIGIASMVAIVSALAKKSCTEQLPNTIVFNFNNGEEARLLGGSSFTKHKWFKSAKAFINLEGTGASYSYRSMLFRTNSLPMVSLVLKNSAYPHASVIVNNLMRFVAR